MALTVACVEVPPAPPPLPPPAPVSVVPPPQVQAPPPQPARKPAPPVLAALPPPAEPTVPAEPVETGGFDRLNGLDPAQTMALLGEPRQRAEAPPAILWRYSSRDCELAIYFYLDLQSREMRILHYEVSGHEHGTERTQQTCYRELVAERRADQAGSPDRPR